MKLCKKWLHPMTKANTVIWNVKGQVIRRCLSCRDARLAALWRRERKNPYREGYCRKGLHQRTAENTVDRGHGLVCLECSREWWQVVKSEQRYKHVRCAHPYCPQRSNRSVDRTDPFLCREHRT